MLFGHGSFWKIFPDGPPSENSLDTSGLRVFAVYYPLPPAFVAKHSMPTSPRTLWFSEHVQPHEPALRAYLSKRFPASCDHDDIVQETYSRLLQLENPDRIVHAKAFLFTTARNAAIDLFRRRSRQPHVPFEEVDRVAELPLLDAVPGVVESIERRQRREALTEALRSLPERCREVMLLRYLDGASGKEIAERLGISLGTVKGHLLKGVRDCARFFEARGLVDAAPSETETNE